MSTKLKLLGVDVGSVGDAHGRTRGAGTYTYIDERERVYKRIVVNKTGKKLLGAVLVGRYGRLRHVAADDAERACPAEASRTP